MRENRRNKKISYTLLPVLLALLLPFMACGETTSQSQVYEKKYGEPKDSKEEAKSLLQVHFIDVGQGDATLITCNGENMLIDAGDNSKGTAVQQYLLKQNIQKLDYVIGTHPDADHVGGLDVIISKFDCGTVFLTEEDRDTDTYQDVLAAMDYRSYEITVPSPGKEFSLGDATFTIEAPLMLGSDSNDNSIVVHLEHGENSFFFAGDAGEEEEKDILSTGRDVQADVYKIGHHGSKTSTGEEMLQTVNPRYAVISVGEGNRYGHPAAEVLNRLRGQGIEVFRTDEQGSIIADSDGKTLRWNCSPSESWQAGEPQGSAAGNEEFQTKIFRDSTAGTAIGTTDEVVYITDTGTKYHAGDCKHLEKSKIEISLPDAKEQGYEPCKICNPMQ